MKILINNSKFRKIDYIIIERLKQKNIFIDLKYNNNYNYDFIFNNSNNFFKIFKIILKNKPLIFKLNIFNKLFKNMDCVILGGGPSAINLSKNDIIYLKNNYFIFAVKYIIEILDKINICADFNILNATISGNKNIHYYTNLAKNTFIFASMRGLKPKNYIDIKFSLYNSSLPHHVTFNEINKGNINVLNYKIINEHLCYNFAHIMLEIVVPMCMFMGFKNIYTFGWDLKGSTTLNPVKYKSTSIINNIGEVKEIVCLKSLNKILKNMGINIYKCSNYSSISFEYKNILNNI